MPLGLSKAQRKEQILAVLRGSVTPMMVSEICDALKHEVGTPYVSSLLLRMEGDGTVKKIGADKKGHYLWALS